MPTSINRLSARAVATLKGPKRYSDGNNLYLDVGASGARRWTFLYRRHGRLREMGLGGFPALSLLEARKSALAQRRILMAGGDPIETRRCARASATAPLTFGSFAASFLAATSSPDFGVPRTERNGR